MGKNELDEIGMNEGTERDYLKGKICSFLGMDEEIKDPEKRKIIEERVDKKLDKFMDRMGDFFMIRTQAFMDCLAEFSKNSSDYTNDYVQAVISRMYKDYRSLIDSKEMSEIYKQKIYMVSMMLLPIAGESLMKQMKCDEEYGKQTCDFIVKALTYFSGYEPEHKIWTEIMMACVPVNEGELS